MNLLVKPQIMEIEGVNNTFNGHSSFTIFDESMELLKQLFSYRLIEKIASPIEKAAKLSHVNEFGKKLWALNSKIQIIQRELESDQVMTISTRQNSMPNVPQKNKSVVSTKSKTVDIRKETKTLYEMYNQVLKDGSFKHYQKIAKLHSLPDLVLLDIDNLQTVATVKKNQRRCC